MSQRAGGLSILQPAADPLGFKHHEGFTENKNIQWVIVVWLKMPRWCRTADQADWCEYMERQQEVN